MDQSGTPFLLVRADRMSHTRCLNRRDNNCIIHFHRALEFVYISDGAMEIMLDGQRFMLSKGQLLAVSSHAIHRYATPESGHCRVLVVIAPLHFIKGAAAYIGDKRFARPVCETPDPCTVLLFERLCARYVNGGVQEDALRALSEALIFLIADQVGLENASDTPANDNAHRILDYTQHHFQEDVSLASLSEYLNYSRSRTSHLFSELFHCDYRWYINTLRCRYAAEQLRGGEDNALNISMNAGFNSLRTFYRAFKKYAGMTPAQYAERMRAHPEMDELSL